MQDSNKIFKQFLLFLKAPLEKMGVNNKSLFKFNLVY